KLDVIDEAVRVDGRISRAERCRQQYANRKGPAHAPRAKMIGRLAHSRDPTGSHSERGIELNAVAGVQRRNVHVRDPSRSQTSRHDADTIADTEFTIEDREDIVRTTRRADYRRRDPCGCCSERIRARRPETRRARLDTRELDMREHAL